MVEQFPEDARQVIEVLAEVYKIEATCRDEAFSRSEEQQHLFITGVRFELHFLEIQNDVGDVFNEASEQNTYRRGLAPSVVFDS